jgi:hypothetical protein
MDMTGHGADMERAMGGAERWSWRWMFDGDTPGAGRRWLFALVASVFAIAGVVVTKAREPAPLAVLAIFGGQVLWQPFLPVTRLDGQLRRDKPAPKNETPLPQRPRSWYRALLGLGALWIVVELLVILAVVRQSERGFWWFLSLFAAAIMVIASIVSILATVRMLRVPAQGPQEAT